MKMPIESIGIIRTPYTNTAPYQPIDDDEGDFHVIIDDAYSEGLKELERFTYIYLIYLIDRARETSDMLISPSFAPDMKVGLFASRSPHRPSRIGLSIVKLKKIEGSTLYTSGLDAFDGTPLLDIKPYIRELDAKCDANYGWLDDLEDRDHLMLHIKGVPHDY